MSEVNELQTEIYELRKVVQGRVTGGDDAEAEVDAKDAEETSEEEKVE